MRLHRFYIATPISGDTIEITDRDLIHQWKRVFRYNVGSQVVVFDGEGKEYLSMITRLGTSGATLSVVKAREVATPKRTVTLVLAVIKKDNFDLALQKAVELGVSHIIPVLTEHSEKKALKIDRLKKIAIEAAEQSGRATVPTVGEVTTLDELFLSGTLPQEKVCFHTDTSAIPLSQYMSTTTQGSAALFIGPEGGFSPQEIALFKSYNTPIVHLLPTTLRAETAAIVGSAAFLTE